MEQRLYFAYGSNMNLGQMAQRCPAAVPIKPVVLRGYTLAFRGHGGVATVLPKAGATVHGMLWDLTPACEQSLDRYEGFPSLYGKESVVVADEKTNANYRVMAYIMTPRNAEIPCEPSRSYFNGILQGYRQNGINPRPLFDALRAAREEVSKMEAQDLTEYSQFNFDWWKNHTKGKTNGNKPKSNGR